MGDEIIEVYERQARELASGWEAVAFEDIHAPVLDLLPTAPGLVFDIGAGSGRDAAWFARRGWQVIAVEPSRALRELGRELHPHPSIGWEDDRLPHLPRLLKRGVQADLVWLSAVVMHLTVEERRVAFRRLATLLKPGGRLVVTLRHGPSAYDRPMHPVSASEVEQVALELGLTVRKVASTDDASGREGISWTALVLELPDDGTGALPIVRGIILQDQKSATYKLALVRVISRIADQSPALARLDEGEVELPLGLVALYWLRMFKPLIERGFPQRPPDRDGKGLGFVKEAFRQLEGIAPHELRPGASFAPPRSAHVLAAVADAAATIKKQPATYAKFPDGRPIFPTERNKRPKMTADAHLTVDPDFLWSFGSTRVPLHLWVAMRRLSVWIEPMLLAEWTRLIEGYAEKSNQSVRLDELSRALRWIDPTRETVHVREILRRLLDEERPIYCVWSGKRITEERHVHIDHCFPFSAWPCDDLWNLLPARPDVNIGKSDKLVTLDSLERAADRIAHWWGTAYRAGMATTVRRFEYEVRSSLPVDPSVEMERAPSGGLAFEPDPTFLWDYQQPAPRLQLPQVSDQAIFEAMRYQRLRLHQDQQLTDWDGAS